MARSGSAADVADLLGLSSRRIQQLAREGILPKAGRGKYPIAKCVQAYVAYQADLAAGAPPEDLETAKRRKMAAEARLKELEVAEQERRLLPMEVHERRVAALLSSLRASVLNVPGKWAPEIVGVPSVPDATIRLRALAGEMLEALQAIADDIEDQAAEA